MGALTLESRSPRFLAGEVLGMHRKQRRGWPADRRCRGIGWRLSRQDPGQCKGDITLGWLFQHRCLNSVSEQSTGSATFQIQTRLSYCEDQHPFQSRPSVVFLLGGQGPDVARGGRGGSFSLKSSQRWQTLRLSVLHESFDRGNQRARIEPCSNFRTTWSVACRD
jgi:hypothetical protein